MPIHDIKFENDMTVTGQTPIGLILQYFIDVYIFFQVFCYQNCRKKEKEKQFKRKLKYTGCACSMI